MRPGCLMWKKAPRRTSPNDRNFQKFMDREFKKEISSLDAVFTFLGEAMDGAPVSAEGVYAINLAVEEFFTNMVKYGRGSQQDIGVSVEQAGGQLRVRLTDRGVEPFDPTATGEVDTGIPLEQRKPGGLGIHLAKRMLDDIRYSYADGASTITIIKNLER
jgi:serine/threonine-protein kinase RsbW